MIQCFGLVGRNGKKSCNMKVKDGCKSCFRHKYLEVYLDEPFNLTIEQIHQFPFCKKCYCLFYQEKAHWKVCQKCQDAHGPYCECFNRAGAPCSHRAKKGETMCLSHIEQCGELKGKQIQHCDACKKNRHTDDFLPNYKTCSTCRERGKTNRDIDRTHRIMCSWTKPDGSPCDFKILKGEKVCGKHIIKYLKSLIESKYNVIFCQDEHHRCFNVLMYDKQFNGKKKKYCKTCQIHLKFNDYKRTDSNFSLEFNYFNKLCTSRCFYCDRYDGIYINGIDRVNPNLSHTVENSVSCCYQCNIMKSDSSLDNFINRCLSISSRKLDDLDEYIDTNECYASVIPERIRIENSLLTYKRNAKKRNIDFRLSFDQFQKLVLSGTCTYCKDNYYFLGLDRVDSRGCYEISNTVPCCTICNRMKNRFTKFDFIDVCHRILQNKEQILQKYNDPPKIYDNMRIRIRRKEYLSDIIDDADLDKLQLLEKYSNRKFIINKLNESKICKW